MISSFISGRAGELESLDLRSSRALIFSNISVGIGSVLSRCRPEGCCVKNNGTQDLFSFLAVGRKPSCSACLQSLLYRSQFSFLRLMKNDVVSG